MTQARRGVWVEEGSFKGLTDIRVMDSRGTLLMRIEVPCYLVDRELIQRLEGWLNRKDRAGSLRVI